MKPVWSRGELPDQQLLEFTIGNDREFDNYLARYDIIGSVAHVKMLGHAGILENDETNKLVRELLLLYEEACKGKLTVDADSEDIHSQIEHLLTKRLGETGKKIHTGRSRNDQVMTDIRLYLRDEIREITLLVRALFDHLLNLAGKYSNVLMPGYTHLQVAMPSSFGLWFSSFAESLADDLGLLHTAFKLVNQNPLGSGAGYGSAFPINREMTTKLLGFDDLIINSVYAQATRGKLEKTVAFALSAIAATVGKMANDICLYSGQNYGFFSFPDKLVTGSSIMPHKRNPDVFEIIRGHCNKIQGLPTEIIMMMTNLSTGYHRDLQLTKGELFGAIQVLKQCLSWANFMLNHISVRENIALDPLYDQMFSVEEVAKRVKAGVPFREAYIQVASDIRQGTFIPVKTLKHTHTGSIGNLALGRISKKMRNQLKHFRFFQIEEAIASLMQP